MKYRISRLKDLETKNGFLNEENLIDDFNHILEDSKELIDQKPNEIKNFIDRWGLKLLKREIVYVQVKCGWKYQLMGEPYDKKIFKDFYKNIPMSCNFKRCNNISEAKEAFQYGDMYAHDCVFSADNVTFSCIFFIAANNYKNYSETKSGHIAGVIINKK